MNAETRPLVLIDDNPMDVDLTLRAFARRKLYNPIQVARDGQQAQELIAHWPAGSPMPAVILLDLKLPKVNGLEVLQFIRQDARFKSIPVVMLTTSAEDRDIATAYALGVNSYIVKPVSFEKFLDVAAQIDLYWMILNQLPPS